MDPRLWGYLRALNEGRIEPTKGIAYTMGEDGNCTWVELVGGGQKINVKFLPPESDVEDHNLEVVED